MSTIINDKDDQIFNDIESDNCSSLSNTMNDKIQDVQNLNDIESGNSDNESSLNTENNGNKIISFRCSSNKLLHVLLISLGTLIAVLCISLQTTTMVHTKQSNGTFRRALSTDVTVQSITDEDLDGIIWSDVESSQQQKTKFPKYVYHGANKLWQSNKVDLDGGVCIIPFFGPIRQNEKAFFTSIRTDTALEYALKDLAPTTPGYVYKVEIVDYEQCNPLIGGITRGHDGQIVGYSADQTGWIVFTNKDIDATSWANKYPDAKQTEARVKADCKLKVVAIYQVQKTKSEAWYDAVQTGWMKVFDDWFSPVSKDIKIFDEALHT